MRALFLSGVSKESFSQSLTDSLDVALEEVEHAMLDPRAPVLLGNLLPKFRDPKCDISIAFYGIYDRSLSFFLLMSFLVASKVFLCSL